MTDKYCFFGWRQPIRIANLDSFRTHLLPEIHKIFFFQKKSQAEYSAYLDLAWMRKKVTAVSHSSAESEGMRHSLSHSVDHWSFDTIDYVSSNIPEGSFPARLHL